MTKKRMSYFNKLDFYKALDFYNERERRFGKTSKQIND